MSRATVSLSLWRFISPLYLGSALNPINSSLIATALVPIALSLHVPVGNTLSILVASLYLACAIAQPTAGKLSEELGPRRVFLSGIVVVIVGGVIGGVGHSLALLVVSRVPDRGGDVGRLSVGDGPHPPPCAVGRDGRTPGWRARRHCDRRHGHRRDRTADRRRLDRRDQLAGGVPRQCADGPAGISDGRVPWIPRDRGIEEGVTVSEIARRVDVTGIAIFACAMSALLVFLLDLPGAEWGFLAAARRSSLRCLSGGSFEHRRLSLICVSSSETCRSPGPTCAAASRCSGVYTVLYGITQWLEAAHGYSAQGAGLLILPMGAVAVVVSRPIAARNLVRGPLIAGAITALLGSIGVLLLKTKQPGDCDHHGDAALRRYHRHGVRVQPDRALSTGAGEAGGHRIGPVSDLQLHRLDRFGDDQQHRLPHEGRRPWSPSDRRDPDRGECRGLAHDSR